MDVVQATDLIISRADTLNYLKDKLRLISLSVMLGMLISGCQSKLVPVHAKIPPPE